MKAIGIVLAVIMWIACIGQGLGSVVFATIFSMLVLASMTDFNDLTALILKARARADQSEKGKDE